MTLLKILAGASLFGAIFFAGEWLRSLVALRRMTYLAREDLKMREETRRERIGHKGGPLQDIRKRVSGLGDTQMLVIAFLLIYIGVSSTLGLLLGASTVTALVSIPLSVGAVLIIDNYSKKRRQAKGGAQVLNVLRLTVSYLENGNPPNIALSRAAGAVDDPLRTDILSCLNSMVGTMGLGEAMRPLAERYPGAATKLLVAALEVNDAQGAQLVPVLRQAENSAKRRIELAAEALAEVAEAKAQFVGVSVVTGLIAFTLLSNSPEAYSTPGSLLMVGLAAANYLWGVKRTLGVFSRARTGLE